MPSLPEGAPDVGEGWWATRRVIAGADPATRVSTRRVRARVEALEDAGWTRPGIARTAGVAPSTITRAMSRPRCSRIVEAAVLSVGSP